MSSENLAAPPTKRFLILGLPRSGTTYLMTLLNAHRDVFCSGEQFNPYAVVGVDSDDMSVESVVGRDRAPLHFMKTFFETTEAQGHVRTGFKFMIGHNIRVLSALAEQKDLTLIYVHRKNKLAQVSSLIKAIETQNWAQLEEDDHIQRKIAAGPRRLSQLWHEYETYDFLFADWFAKLPQRKATLEYREMFHPGFEAKICEFLGIGHDPQMKSPLVKQGTNNILDRFEYRKEIADYFEAVGFEHWLDPEL